MVVLLTPARLRAKCNGTNLVSLLHSSQKKRAMGNGRERLIDLSKGLSIELLRKGDWGSNDAWELPELLARHNEAGTGNTSL